MNVGVVCGSTVKVIVVVVAHCPAVGVNVDVYVPGVVVLNVEGLHVPEIPLVEVPGSVGDAAFWQTLPSGLNVGVVGAFTTTVIVVVAPHCPAVGVKVYVVDPTVAVLTVEGDHVPLIPFVEVVGSVPGVAF